MDDSMSMRLLANSTSNDELCPFGMVLPLFGEAELELPTGVLTILYGLGLFWSFLAVGIVADVFMSGIETITSQTKRIKGPDGKEYEVKVRQEQRSTRSDENTKIVQLLLEQTNDDVFSSTRAHK
jgi:hypothetical protein